VLEQVKFSEQVDLIYEEVEELQHLLQDFNSLMEALHGQFQQELLY
jgi:hypothetical protein